MIAENGTHHLMPDISKPNENDKNNTKMVSFSPPKCAQLKDLPEFYHQRGEYNETCEQRPC
jgi:hypothetical protein